MSDAAAIRGHGASRFPKRAVAVGIAAMLLIAGSSVGTNWFVGERVATITRSQITVLGAAQQLRLLSEQRELVLREAIESGEQADESRFHRLGEELQSTLADLQNAIILDANRQTFLTVLEAEREGFATETRALELAGGGLGDEAKALLTAPAYKTSRAVYRAGLHTIQNRSRQFVETNRQAIDRNLLGAVIANVAALLILAAAWLYIIRIARRWARQLKDAQRASDIANQAKGDFLAVMSHEIRTPLNSVIGFADVLLADSGLTPDQRRQIRLIQEAGGMLMTTVNDVLDFSKLEAGKVELFERPFLLDHLVDNCMSILRPLAQSKGLDLRVDCAAGGNGAYVGDEDRIRQILVNLLNNALKFTDAGGVALVVRALPADRLRFEVIDSGVGIAPEHQERLFEPFAQSDSSIARRFGGTGLGLSISRRLVEAMDGTIGLVSTPGSGSTFWFEIPLRRSGVLPGHALDANCQSSGPARPAQILLAEDLPMNQELAVALLERAGHAVDVVSDGKAAVAAVSKRSYDLVLMDIQMPEMDGIAATRAIRALPSPAGETPIIALSANVMPDQVQRYHDAGMNGQVAKPIRQPELHSAIARIMGTGPAADQSGQALEADPVIDLGRLEMLRRTIPANRLAIHARSLCEQVEGAALAGAAGDSAACAAQAHKIASQAGTFGLLALERSARELEDACNRMAGVAGRLDCFEQAASAAFECAEFRAVLA